MGRKALTKPARLAEKLLQIRNALGLSQAEWVRRLGLEDVLEYKQISEFETGKAEPPLPVLLRYARAANLSTDSLIDDELDLPIKLPASGRRR